MQQSKLPERLSVSNVQNDKSLRQSPKECQRLRAEQQEKPAKETERQEGKWEKEDSQQPKEKCCQEGRHGSTKSYAAAKLRNRSENYLSWKSLVRKSLENGWGRNQRKWVEERLWEIKTHKNTMITLSIENSHSQVVKPNRSTQLIKKKSLSSSMIKIYFQQINN